MLQLEANPISKEGKRYQIIHKMFILFAPAKRTNQDPRTLGTLFHACCEELQQATFAEALALVLIFLEQGMGTATEITRDLLRSLIDRFLRELPPIYGER